MIDSQKIVPYFYCGLHCNYISEVLITSTCYINYLFIFWQYFNHKFCWSKNFDIYLHYYSFYTCALDVLVSVLNKFWNKLHAVCCKGPAMEMTYRDHSVCPSKITCPEHLSPLGSFWIITLPTEYQRVKGVQWPWTKFLAQRSRS